MDSVRAERRERFPPLGKNIKALMVWPRIPPSFWGFNATLDLIPEESIHPPLGLITVAALCPQTWSIRLIDRALSPVQDGDLEWADLLLISSMHVQRTDTFELLKRARRLGKRTMIGGPFASSQPDVLLELADHVVVGEPDEVFDRIAEDLETGNAARLYTIVEKPDVSRTPPPRFELLEMGRYASMAVQFSRGCPFQCEFCDIITIYGRKPRTKSIDRFIDELETLRRQGWHKQVFVVDDNFIGNRRVALDLCREVEAWQRANNYPFILYTEASIDLVECPALVEAMVRANFFHVFIGIESPSKSALKETRKFQNLRRDPEDSVRQLQRLGLWVTGGFIVGFDSDTDDIFERQIELIDRGAISWAMAGFLQAPPTTPLFDRMLREGRLLLDSTATSNFSPPNFRTVLPPLTMLRGLERILLTIYDPAAFYQRAFRSLLYWKTTSHQKAPHYSVWHKARVVVRSVWFQGIRSNYRRAYWTFLIRVLALGLFNPSKLWLGFTILVSGHHFIGYSREVAAELREGIAREEAAYTHVEAAV